MKKLFIVLFSLCLVLSVFLTLVILKPGAQSVKVVPHNLNNPLYESYLKTENGFSYISVSKNEKDLNNVKEILSVLDAQVSVCLSNINQHDNSSYRRLYVLIKDGKLDEIQTSEDFILKYEPENPQAIRTGPEKGYVKYPDISILTETIELKTALEDISVFQTALHKIAPELIEYDYRFENEVVNRYFEEVLKSH